MFWGPSRGPAAHYSPRPAHPYTAIATVTALRSNPPDAIRETATEVAQDIETATEVAQDVIERLFTAGLDLRKVVRATGSDLAARRLREAIDQLDAVINGIFAAVLDQQRPSCDPRFRLPK
jgi:hypothetical protein